MNLVAKCPACDFEVALQDYPMRPIKCPICGTEYHPASKEQPKRIGHWRNIVQQKQEKGE